MLPKTIAVVCAVLLVVSTADARKNLLCHWSASMPANLINGNYCTHVLYSSIALDASGNLQYGHHTEAQAMGFIADLRFLRSIFPHLRIMVSIGGWEASNTAWSSMAASPAARSNFARTLLDLAISQQLNGIDISWQFPNYNGNSPQDMFNFNLLLLELRTTLGSSYEISVALGAGEWRTNLSYDVPAIFELADFVSLMAFEMTGGFNSVTGIHSALYEGPNDLSGANAHNAVNVLVARGAIREKLILGVASYGVAFTLASPFLNGVGSPAAGGAPGLPFRLICQRLNVGTLTGRWENSQASNYAFDGTFWIGYDNIDAAWLKAVFINFEELGGAMLWNLDDDDYNNVCGIRHYPLLWELFTFMQ